MVEYLDRVLLKVTEVLDLGLSREQTEARIKELLEMEDQMHGYVFNLIQKNAQKYPLLVGFCYQLGIGTANNEREGFNYGKKDATSYGHYFVGRCYLYGLGVDIDYEKAFSQFKLSANAGNSSGQNGLGIL